MHNPLCPRLPHFLCACAFSKRAFFQSTDSEFPCTVYIPTPNTPAPHRSDQVRPASGPPPHSASPLRSLLFFFAQIWSTTHQRGSFFWKQYFDSGIKGDPVPLVRSGSGTPSISMRLEKHSGRRERLGKKMEIMEMRHKLSFSLLVFWMCCLTDHWVL